MANEIQVSIVVTFSKSSVSDGFNFAFTPTWSASPPKVTRTVQALSTSEEAIILGEATGGGGVVGLRNLDATNDIHIRQATGAANFLTLKPGEGWVFRWSTSTTAPFAIAAAGTPALEIITLAA